MGKLTLKKVEDMAVVQMETNGQHSPQIMIEHEGTVAMVVLCFRNTKEKDQMFDKIRGMVTRSKVDSYFYISEAWMSEQNENTPMIRPRQRVDRKEILIMAEFRKDRKNKSVIREFKKSADGKIVWGDRKAMDDGERSVSFIDFYANKEEVSKIMDADAEKAHSKYLNNLSKKMAKKYSAEFKKVLDNSDDEGFNKLMDKLQAEAEAEKKRIRQMMLEDPEATEDEYNNL